MRAYTFTRDPRLVYERLSQCLLGAESAQEATKSCRNTKTKNPQTASEILTIRYHSLHGGALKRVKVLGGPRATAECFRDKVRSGALKGGGTRLSTLHKRSP